MSSEQRSLYFVSDLCELESTVWSDDGRADLVSLGYTQKLTLDDFLFGGFYSDTAYRGGMGKLQRVMEKHLPPPP